MRPYYILLIVLLLLCPQLSEAAQLQTVTDRTRTSLEESFTLELRATGSVDGEPDLSVLEKDFELLGRSQSSQIQIVNTGINRTTTWSLSLLARSSGKKQIPPLCIGSDCSNPVAIEVLPAGQVSSSASSSSELLLEVSAEAEKLWVQSQLLYKVRLLTRHNFMQASLTDPEPSGVEAVVQKLGEDRNYETERDGLRYRVIERTYAIFPQQSGLLTIPPIRFAAQIAEGRSRSFDPFNQRTRQLRKKSQEITIEVHPAADLQGRSWLPTTELRLEDDWQQPPQLTVGEPATRTITLRANGLPSAQLPSVTVEIPDGVRSYPDQPSRQDQFNDGGVLGILQQKLALVPTRPGRLRMPEIKVDWWDLQSKSWRQTLLPALEIEVLPAAAQPAMVVNPPAEQPEAAPVEQTPQTEKTPDATAPAEPGLWPWLSLLLGSGWLLTLFWLAKTKVDRRREKNERVQEDETLSVKKARRELQQALKSGDQAQVRSALLSWGAALFPQQRPGNLEELADLCGEPLKQQLELFGRSLYSRGREPWDAQELLVAVQQVEQNLLGAQDNTQLPPLYPQ
jgi:hypothetical protein